MSTQIVLEDDVRDELIKKAIELDMFFSPANDVLRMILGITKKEAVANNDNYPSSKDSEVQKLLDGLKDIIFSISKDGMNYHSSNRRWVANPNVVTITVQDARAKNLRITVYGRPIKFNSIKGSLEIKDDMAGYSRFVIDSVDKVIPAVEVIKHSLELKDKRGQLR